MLRVEHSDAICLEPETTGHFDRGLETAAQGAGRADQTDEIGTRCRRGWPAVAAYLTL